MSHVHDLQHVVAMLADRAEDLARQLYPLGVKDGNEWRIGSVRGERGKSMAIHIGRGQKAGVWKDFSTSDQHGDALDLVAHALFAGDKKQGYRWARSWLGLEGASHQEAAAAARRVAARSKQQDDDADEKKMRAKAWELWSSARPILDTPAERYLLGRGIDLRALSRLPGSPRFHAECFCAETGSYEPALVHCIGDALRGQFVAAHRTYLEVRRDGSVTKADLNEPKKTLGRWKGGMIRLWRGASGKPLNDAPAGSTMMISEGSEDGYQAVLARSQYYCGAAISVGNMANIVLPETIATVILLRQNDTAREAIDALDKAIGHFLGQGKEVRALDLPRVIGGAPCKDVDDMARLVG